MLQFYRTRPHCQPCPVLSFRMISDTRCQRMRYVYDISGVNMLG